jgi:polysaccharide biosynthesis protein PslJ
MQLNLERWLFTGDMRGYALLTGALVGLLGGVSALLLVVAGPVMTFGFMFAAIVGLLALSNLDIALVVLIATTALLPYGTLPFDVGVTPSLIDVALATLIVVYLFQWMTGRRMHIRLNSVHLVFAAFLLILLAAFVLGTGNAPLTPGVLRRFVGLMANIVMALVIFDIVRTHQTARRIAATFIGVGAVSGLIGTVLWLLPDFTAETILNRLGRIGYPVGGVIRYREDGVSIGIERAIGTWIDPNAYGGFLMMVGALTAPQLLARRPVFGRRWLAFALFGVIALALFLTNSRGSMLGLVAGVGFVSLIRYRQLIWGLVAAAAVMPFLPPTRALLERLYLGFTGADLETQMRFGEYGDALELIARYPVIGVGFSAPPDIDLYLGFASTYLTIASNAGLLGLGAYLLTLGSVAVFGIVNRRAVLEDNAVNDVWFGFMAGIVGAMVSGIFDHFYFNIEFQATSLTFWLYVGMFMAIVRISNPPDARAVYGQVHIPNLPRIEPPTDDLPDDERIPDRRPEMSPVPGD